MSYRLETHESLADGIRRIVLEQIDQALEQLTNLPDGRDAAVHDARKRLKKIRAVLRLVRDEFGDDMYHAENVCFRDAGRRLSAVRDSAVLVETLDYVVDHAHDELLDPTLIATIRQRLSYAHEYLSEHILESESARVIVIDTITQARERVPAWPMDNDNFLTLADGLRRVYKRGRHRLADAYESPSTENFHEWRKRAKYLWYHMRILNPLWPDVLDEIADEIHTLSNLLGLDHDLAVFLDKVVNLPELSDDDQPDVFAKLIGQKRAVLQAQAKPVGERIYAAKPKSFVRWFATYWGVWQAEGSPA